MALTAVALLASTVAVWAERTVLDSDRFTAVVSDVLDDPAVIDPVAAELTDQLLTLIIDTGAVQSALGPLAPATPILVGAVRGTIADRVGDLLRTDTAQDLLAGAVRRAHARTVALLRGDGLGFRVDALSIETGEVRLDLSGLLIAALQGLGDLLPGDWQLPDIGSGVDQLVAAVEDRFDVDLPDDFGTVVVYDSDALARAEVAVAQAQRGLVLIERAIALIVVATVLLAVGAIAVSPHRRRTIVQLGVAVAIAAALAVLVIGRVLDALPLVITDPDARQAAAVVVSSFSSGLIRLAQLLLVLGSVAAIAGWLTGPSGSAHAARVRIERAGGPARAFVAHRDGARVTAGVLALVVVWWWGWSWLTLVVAAAIVAVGIFGPSGLAGRTPAESVP